MENISYTLAFSIMSHKNVANNGVYTSQTILNIGINVYGVRMFQYFMGNILTYILQNRQLRR